MSAIDFAGLRAEHPELKQPLVALEGWLRQNPAIPFLDPRILAIELDAFSIQDILSLLHVLTAHGDVTPKLVVRDPNGHIVEGEFDTADQIPEKLPNRTYDHYFKVRQENILPIYKLEEVASLP